MYSGVVAAAITSNGNGSLLDYNYSYDYLWRMTEASLPASDAWSEKGLTYDRNGNIRSLTRLGSDGTVKADLSSSYYVTGPMLLRKTAGVLQGRKTYLSEISSG